ncbi:MAG: hypothetical protein K6C08_09935, partial [Oscillospiraceae bacterium]|nr:hypothetical protein [Oscillospiraceae bacterium]
HVDGVFQLFDGHGKIRPNDTVLINGETWISDYSGVLSLVTTPTESPTTTETPTPTESPTPTETPTPTEPPTPTETPTPTESPTPTETPTPTEPPTPTETPTPTEPPTPTETPTPTEPPTPTETPTPTESPTPAETPTPTQSPTPTETPTPTESPTPTETPTPTESPTPAETPTPTESPTPAETPTPTEPPTPTPTESPTPAETPTPTESPTPEIPQIPEEGWHENEEGKKFYVREGERLFSCIEEIDGVKYHFDADGLLITGARMIDGLNYLSGADGHYIGIVQYNSWNTIDGERYYIQDGQPVKEGPLYINWILYHFDEDGRMMHDCVAGDCILDREGLVVQSGWVELEDGRYYVEEENHTFVRDCELSIENEVYVFDASGRLITETDGRQDTETTEAGTGSANKPETEEADPDDDYVPKNEDETDEQDIQQPYVPPATSGGTYSVNRSTTQGTAGTGSRKTGGGSQVSITERSSSDSSSSQRKVGKTPKLQPGCYSVPEGVRSSPCDLAELEDIAAIRITGCYAVNMQNGERLRNCVLQIGERTLYTDRNGRLAHSGLRMIGGWTFKIYDYRQMDGTVFVCQKTVW